MPMPSSGHRKTKHTINAPGHAHELTFSCHRREPLLLAERHRQWLVESIDHARIKWSFDLWAWVLMPEHVHVLIRPREYEYDMAKILTSIKLPVAKKAMAYPKTHARTRVEQCRIVRPNGRVEHRFWQQGGGYDRNIIDPGYVLTAIEYIHNNPVRRGLVDSSLEWKWSSAGWYAGREDAKLKMDPLTI